MSQVVIENPVINSPFDEPRRHFRFTDEGITNEIVEARRVEPLQYRQSSFDPPETGKIAIKVINHYGDEILEVFTCPTSGVLGCRG